MTALNRRALLAGAASVAAAQVATPVALAAPAPPAATDANARAMETVLRFKQAYAIAYRRLAATPGLDRSAGAMLELFAGHEHAHVTALLAPTAFLGGRLPVAPTEAEVERFVPALASARGSRMALEAAVTIENASLQLLILTEQELTDARLIQAVAEVTCCDAQHVAQLRVALGRNPIPAPFEAGQAH